MDESLNFVKNEETGEDDKAVHIIQSDQYDFGLKFVSKLFDYFCNDFHNYRISFPYPHIH